ncbi:MAG: hemolysin family protein [Mycobacteriales bacterium]
MSKIVLSALVVLVLIMFEGLFVAAELALVSLREGQIKAMTGRRGAAVARLAANPNRFLAAAQLGVTLTALLSSAFGAVTLTESAASGLEDAGLNKTWASVVAFLLITGAITYVTLVIGELAPKRLALQHSTAIARIFGPTLDRIAKIVRPVIWSLSFATDLVVRLLGGDPRAGREGISEEELRGLVAAHESLSGDERRLIDEVFDAGDTQVREVMIPRTECSFLDAEMPVQDAFEIVQAAPHSRYPVIRGSSDDILGFIHVRDLMTPNGRAASVVGDLARPVKLFPATKKVLPALAEMRREGAHLAVVVDEYGGTAGIVTLEDLIEEVIGDIRDEYDEAKESATLLRDGDREVDGLLNLGEFREQVGVDLPQDGPYETVAGFVMSGVGRVARVGDAVEHDQYRLTVTELDGRRIARVRVTLLDQLAGEPDHDSRIADHD